MKVKNILASLTLVTISIGGIVGCSSIAPTLSVEESRIDNLKWFMPSATACTQNNGVEMKGKKYSVKGKTICKSKFEDAPKICKASGGRLPKDNELQNVCKNAYTFFINQDRTYHFCLHKKEIYPINQWIQNKKGAKKIVIGEKFGGSFIPYNRQSINGQDYFFVQCVK